MEGKRGNSVTIVTYEGPKRPYDEFLFVKKAAIVREAAGLPSHLQVRDLRRTGITETRAGGATTHELQATSGNDLESLQVYAVLSNAEAAWAIRKRQRYRAKLKERPDRPRLIAMRTNSRRIRNGERFQAVMAAARVCRVGFLP